MEYSFQGKIRDVDLGADSSASAESEPEDVSTHSHSTHSDDVVTFWRWEITQSLAPSYGLWCWSMYFLWILSFHKTKSIIFNQFVFKKFWELYKFMELQTIYIYCLKLISKWKNTKKPDDSDWTGGCGALSTCLWKTIGNSEMNHWIPFI